jgi:hypothetical protein
MAMSKKVYVVYARLPYIGLSQPLEIFSMAKLAKEYCKAKQKKAKSIKYLYSSMEVKEVVNA